MYAFDALKDSWASIRASIRSEEKKRKKKGSPCNYSSIYISLAVLKKGERERERWAVANHLISSLRCERICYIHLIPNGRVLLWWTLPQLYSLSIYIFFFSHQYIIRWVLKLSPRVRPQLHSSVMNETAKLRARVLMCAAKLTPQWRERERSSGKTFGFVNYLEGCSATSVHIYILYITGGV